MLRKLYNFVYGKVSWKLLWLCQTLLIQFIGKLFCHLWWQIYANIYFIGKLYVLHSGLMARSCNCYRKYLNWSLALKATLKCVTSKIYSTISNIAVCLDLNKSRTFFCHAFLTCCTCSCLALKALLWYMYVKPNKKRDGVGTVDYRPATD